MFSDRLIEAIHKKQYSRYKIAKETKITEATLSNYCNGKGKPSPSIVKQLASFLDVDFNWLLNGDPNFSDVISDSEPTGVYKTRKRKKPYVKTDVNSVISFFEEQLKEKDQQINRLTSIIEDKLDALHLQK